MAAEVMDFDCEMKMRGPEFSEDSELEIELESDEALEEVVHPIVARATIQVESLSISLIARPVVENSTNISFSRYLIINHPLSLRWRKS